MRNKLLDSIYGVAGALGNPLDYLEDAEKKYGDIRTYFSKYKNPVGIELEIENVSSEFKTHLLDSTLFWTIKEDSSLKIRGCEFVSIPLSGKNIDYAIHEFAHLSRGQEFLYSVRTSIHVHVNVAYMTEEEWVSFILLSAYLEPLLYTLCDPQRKESPYCYPISNLAPGDVFSIKEDLKYCGINTAPTSSQLTIEFRHMHGHNNWKLLRRWIQVLCKIQYYAKTKSGKEVRQKLREVIRTKNHEQLVKSILGASIILFPNLTVCDDNLLWVLSAIVRAEHM
jgi:hypothetical protein